jgi:hypothetical protein
LNFQCICASLFPFSENPYKPPKNQKYQKYHKYLPAIPILAIIAVSVLSPVLPYVLKKAQKAYHLAGLIFFAVVYILLLLFYGYGFFKYYWKPKHQEQEKGENLISKILRSNMVLSSIAILSAVPSAALYMTDNIDFELSLWVS